METWWAHSHRQGPESRPKLSDYLEGTFKDATMPSFVYVAEIHGHPDFLKIGFSKVDSNDWVESEKHYKKILYRTCNDEVISSQFGDLPRAEAWLIEQYLLSRMTDKRERISELEERRARGFTETIKVPAGHERERTLEWIKREVYDIIAAGDSGWVKMMNALTKDQNQQALYEKRKLDVVLRHSELVAAEEQNKIKERNEYEKKLLIRLRRQINDERYGDDFMAEYNFTNSD